MIRQSARYLTCIILVAGLSGCSQTQVAEDYGAMVDEIGALTEYEVNTSCAVRVEEGTGLGDPEGLVLNYTARERRSVSRESLSKRVKYYDQSGRHLFDWEALYTHDALYVGVDELYGYIFDTHGLAEQYGVTAPELLGGNSHLSAPHTGEVEHHPALFLPHVEEELLLTRLGREDGAYSITLSGEEIVGALPELIDAILVPMEAMADFQGDFHDAFGVAADDGEALREALYARLDGEGAGGITYHTTLSGDGEAGGWSLEAELTVPDLMRAHLTMEITRSNTAAPEPPADAVTPEKLSAMIAEAVRDKSFLGNTDMEVVYNLAGVRLTGHELDEDTLLSPYPLDEDGELSVPVTDGSEISELGGSLYSYTDAVTLIYTALPMDLASELMGAHVLADLEEAFDDEEDLYALSPLRLNRGDTAAALSLSFGDEYVGETVSIYVVQALPDHDLALCLNVIAIAENMDEGATAVLEELGGLIGLDFFDYLEGAHLP